ncbi:MAG: hypothetical protein AAFN27_24095 [Pseudomonadota bacterium]
MGGIGSGRRWHFDARKTTSNFRSIDVRHWHRDGLLNPGNQFGWNWSLDGAVTASIHVRVEHRVVRLLYKTRGNGEDWREMDYPVTLESTECNFGGSRKWFICPAWGCRRRVAVLHGGAVFACRTCHQIAYPSQNETAPDRGRQYRKDQGLLPSERPDQDKSQRDATDDAGDQPRTLDLPCPHCGGRLIIIESFPRGCQPRAPPPTPTAGA